ncbi:DNA-binding transcriptional regulator, MocR family / aminotransferase domain [hydrothermal vent metagenome]|uniref:DNA-binding transcriptional regulator, MocR family / aminotransferase domain n=2 Tax=hydrothermal vent metagenome TaxID=652676 RepID=A0A3B0YTH4_9ZZZZ
MAVQFRDKNSQRVTLVTQVMQEVHQRIANRRLVPGAKLPSIRKFAQIMQVSKSTVVDAYDRLAAQGVIQARRGSGFYVAGHLPPLKLADVGPQVDRTIDPLWVSRQSLEAGKATLKPGCGWLPASWMPEQGIRRALRSLSRSELATLTEYGTPHGFVPLREHLLWRMAGHQIAAGLDQVMLTTSGTQTIDLLCRFFLEPGNTVLVDDPCYFNFHALLKAHRVKVVSVPYTPTGPDLELFEQALRDHQPRLYITNSAIHNPTGAVLSPVVAHQLLKLAEQSDVIIIEDDIFADLETTPAPRLAALDGLNRVVHIGSFSKTLSAAARCGFIAARQDWIEGLIDLKIATSFGGEPFSAELTWRVLTDGSYRKHLDGLHERLSHAMGKTCARLSDIGIEPWLRPQAGMYVWCTLPENLSASDVAGKALAKGLILAPGNVFSLTDTASRFLRFNVAQSASPKIFDILKSLILDE